MENQGSSGSRFGETLALVVGVCLVLGGVVNALAGGGNVVTTILVLIGASALSGWVKARQKRLGAKRAPSSQNQR